MLVTKTDDGPIVEDRRLSGGHLPQLLQAPGVGAAAAALSGGGGGGGGGSSFARDHARGLGHFRQPTTVPGVILRRGNYFGDDCLIQSKPRWGTSHRYPCSWHAHSVRDSNSQSAHRPSSVLFCFVISTLTGTVTALALSVFLTLTKANFDKVSAHDYTTSSRSV